jgi:hypothetical protein
VTPLQLRQVSRSAVPLRVAFLHQPQALGGPGPLSRIVRSRRETALDLLLLAHALWPTTDPNPIAASAAEWESAIGMPPRPGNRAMISRSWTWLEEQRLIRSSHRGRVRLIEVRREDASGLPWLHPRELQDAYMQLPHDYWYGGFARNLSLPAKAMLLIGLSLQTPPKTYFEFPLQRSAGWYGLTPKCAAVGLRDLRQAGLLRTWVSRRESPLSPVGVTFDRRHHLNPLDAATYGRMLAERLDLDDTGEYISF